MIVTEQTADGRVRHYSDRGKTLRQVETGKEYDDAVDELPCRYTYEETETEAYAPEIDDAELVNILLGEGLEL